MKARILGGIDLSHAALPDRFENAVMAERPLERHRCSSRKMTAVTLQGTLGHYRILEPIGEGGMGEVYAAEDTRLHRRVALKVLPRLLADDPERRLRFEREAQAIAALNHPNIVTIHSVEESDGIPFLTMEMVDGKPLTDVIPRDGLPVPTLLKIAIAISDAIAAAQQRGITHRDLKPANVMVTGEGRVKVLDFGVAKVARSGNR